MNPAGGPELDALVAEKIMGWRRDDSNPEHQRLIDPETGDHWTFCDCVNAVEMPEFSTDIAEAWRVVEWMQAVGYTMNLFVHVSSPHMQGKNVERMIVVTFTKDPGAKLIKHRSFKVRSLSAPESICRAALAAAEHEARQ